MPTGRLFPVLAVCVLVGLAGCKRKSSKSEASGADHRAPAETALPGADPLPRDLYQRMQAEVAGRGPDYRPRTRHLTEDGGPRFTNRLIFEASPYLGQHAHNPVNWYPWGDEAFAAAAESGRPIFLSIGYSTCHWCHVMEEESFEDPEIAAYLNQHFIAIKVDREERPDLDSVYMTAVQMMTGSGGWPMSVFLTPDRKPFFGGTYFPPRTGARGARTGFLEILGKIQGAWKNDRAGIFTAAKKLSEAVRKELAPGVAGHEVNAALALRRAAALYQDRFDAEWGGLMIRRGESKFPSSFPVRLLLRYWRRTGEDPVRDKALYTLRKMAAGGIYDQVGGGFHRYATDKQWLVPHFEKMLYDNALLVPAYLDGYQVSGDEALAEVARETLRYLAREMTAPGGGFYSATDADSRTADGHREEGAFFVWTPAEIDAALQGELEPRGVELVKAYYAVTEEGNFEGANILWRPRSLAEVAAEQKVDLAEARETVDRAREILYRVRADRPPPLRDDKIIAAWNGLAISAFARAALVLGDPDYAEQARRAGRFITGEMRTGNRLRRTFTGGEARGDGFLTDYAFVIAGLLDLFEATGESDWLAAAFGLDRELAERFEDPDGGGFFMTAADHEKLLAREKPADDGALPSGNAVAAMNLVRMFELTGDDTYRARAERLLSAFATELERKPGRSSEMLAALDMYTDTVKQIVVVTPGDRRQAAPFLAELRRRYLPAAVLVVVPEPAVDELARLVPLVGGKKALRGETTAYVCEAQRCELPTRKPSVFAGQISAVAKLPE